MGTRNDLRISKDGVLYCGIVNESLNNEKIAGFPFTSDYNITCQVVENPALTEPCKYIASENTLYVRELREYVEGVQLPVQELIRQFRPTISYNTSTYELTVTNMSELEELTGLSADNFFIGICTYHAAKNRSVRARKGRNNNGTADFYTYNGKDNYRRFRTSWRKIIKNTTPNGQNGGTTSAGTYTIGHNSEK